MTAPITPHPLLIPAPATAPGQPPAARTTQLLPAGHHAEATIRLSDTSGRAVERRTLAATLAPAFGLYVHRRTEWASSWSTATDGSVLRTDTPVRHDGPGRDVLVVSGPADAVARYCAALPTLLVELDRAAAEHTRTYTAWLREQAEQGWSNPREHRTMARHWRRHLVEALASILASGRAPAGPAFDPTVSWHHQTCAAAADLARELGWTWLAQWEQPTAAAALASLLDVAVPDHQDAPLPAAAAAPAEAGPKPALAPPARRPARPRCHGARLRRPLARRPDALRPAPARPHHRADRRFPARC
ncbi:hypothetical protein ABTX81_30480 [Kitasatospora sp. NPDC097605]|uniref:hypothetical protein n=1 Tax=Kitasatospora sp. NPDC097605 TaxID=3157226 RepID=UPI00331E51CF